MRVVLLSKEYPPFIHGGVGTFVKNLAIGLSKENVKVTVISGYPVHRLLSHVEHAKTYEEKNSGLDIIRFPYLDIHPKNAFFQLLNLKRICETVKKINPDILHGQSLSTFPALIKLKKYGPIMVTFHTSPKTEKALSVYSLPKGGGFYDFGKNVLGYPVWSFISRKEFYNSNMAVTVSKNLMFELLEEMGEAYREKIREVHNGVDVETLETEYRSVEDCVEESNNTLLFAGRLVWRKGALNLIKLAYYLHKKKLDFELIVHGDGPLFGSIKRAVQNFGLTNVELRGFTSRAEMMRSMRRSKFVVIPSFYEACPMILLEGMCLGKIPVMFNLPYSREFTENGEYGILTRGSKEMVDRLRIACMELDLQSFSDKVKDFAKRKYNVRNMALRYLNLYKAMHD